MTTVYHLPLLPSKVVFIVSSLAVSNDRGEQSNALQLSPEQLRQRAVYQSDLLARQSPLCAVSWPQPSLSPAEDPALFRSATRPSSTPLPPSYASACAPPFACVYAAFDVRCRVWPVQAVAEEWVSRELTAVWLHVLRLCWCWQDDWRAAPGGWRAQWMAEAAAAPQDVVEGRATIGSWEEEVLRLESSAGSDGSVVRSAGGELFGRDEDGRARSSGRAARKLTDAVSKWRIKARL